jgi:hypothetical protein
MPGLSGPSSTACPPIAAPPAGLLPLCELLWGDWCFTVRKPAFCYAHNFYIEDHHDIYVTISRINYMSVTTIPGKANPVCGNRMVDEMETKKGLPKPGGFYT